MNLSKDYFTTHETAKFLSVTPTTVIQWIKEKRINAVRTLGGHRRVSKHEIDKVLKKYHSSSNEITKKRILIIDDDKSVREGLKAVFEKEEFLADVANDGFEAGTFFLQNIPDIVILDLIMPGMDGFRTCKFIKSNKEFKKVKILVLTGYPSKENIKKSMRAGADKVIAKPVDNKMILNEAGKLLGINYKNN